MNVKTGRDKIISLCVAVAVLIAAACLCRPVFYLNDDVTIRSILSGSYTGVPDGHAVYMKYPLTGILSILYRIAGKLPWMELFFAGCLLWTVAEMVSVRKKCKKDPVLLLLSGMVFIIPMFLYMHYTIIAAVLAGTAAFCLCGEVPVGRKCIKPLLLWLLSWMVRSQVAYLALPFMGVALLWSLTSGKTVNSRADVLERDGRPGKFLAGKLSGLGKSLLLALAGFVLCYSVNEYAYAGPEWQEYLTYNEARTDLYDYTNFLSTGYYGEHYEEYGMDREKFLILNSYNTLLDEGLDTTKMAEVAERVTAGMEALKEPAAGLKEAVRQYYYQIRYGENAYVILWLILSGVLAAALFLGRNWRGLFLFICLAGGRSLIWIFLLFQGRFPERISTSLYVIELLLLAGMLGNLPADCKTNLRVLKQKLADKWAPVGVIILIGQVVFEVSILGCLMGQMKIEAPKTLAQAAVLQEWDRLQEYCRKDPETLYLVDVFSAVEYGDFQYKRGAENVKLAGGWMSASPLAEQCFTERGVADGGEALYEDADTVFLAEKGKNIEWLEEYLIHRFGACELKAEEEIVCGEDKTMVKYRVIKEQ